MGADEGPARSVRLRLRLRADGGCPLEWSMEGAASAAEPLAGSPFAEV
ncbi:hypothetical protein [Streptacidiphilus sp. EB103A]